MAIASTTVWEVRTSGNDANGGGFNSARGGTDYSQQDAAQLSLTDLACASNTTLTSATGGFTAAMVGNLVYVASGTNAAAGYYEITAYSDTNTVTIDRTCASGGNMTSGVGKVGGACATPVQAFVGVAGQNTVWIKAGTYTCNTLITTPAGAAGAPTLINGYNATRGDLSAVNNFANFPLLQRTSGTGYMVTLGNYGHIKDIVIDGGDLATRGVNGGGANAYNNVSNVKVYQCTDLGILLCGAVVRCLVTDMKAASTSAYYNEGGVYCYSYCIAADNPCTGWRLYGNGILNRCIADTNTGASSDGFRVESTHGLQAFNCVAYANGRDGFRAHDSTSANLLQMFNCIAYGNTGYGINSNTTTWVWLPINYNALGSNTAGARNKVPTGANDVTLTADPFVDAANGNFALNTTAGGGAACRAAGIPGVLPLGLTTGYEDIGIAQHADPAGGGGGAKIIGG